MLEMQTPGPFSPRPSVSKNETVFNGLGFVTLTQRSGFAIARLYAGLTSGRAYGARGVAI
jgi:hypothetical protein